MYRRPNRLVTTAIVSKPRRQFHPMRLTEQFRIIFEFELTEHWQ